jgi:FAD/FMN-containing dehydrogenase
VIAMCEKCVKLDKKIEHYERIRLSIADQVTMDRIKELIAEMKTQKAEFHPKKE